MNIISQKDDYPLAKDNVIDAVEEITFEEAYAEMVKQMFYNMNYEWQQRIDEEKEPVSW